jgi:REP element-mobilizing transposase RayT
MARKPRIHYPGALYHVTLRGNARQDIFFDDEDRCRFCLLLQEGIERFGHRIVAFCLMTNHVHLAVQVGNVSLSRIMQNLAFRYTQRVNQRLNRSGHLFQGRYKAIIVDADSHLLELPAYLHLNPIRADMVQNPEDFLWSSHRAYLGLDTIPWLSSDYVLSCFSPDLVQARRLFAGFVNDRIADGHRDEFYGKGSEDSRIVGEDCFVEDVLRAADSLPLLKPSLDAVLKEVTSMYNLGEDDLKTANQKRLPSEARGLAVWAVLELTDASLNQLAERIGRDASTLSKAARRFEIRCHNNPEQKKKMNRLKKKLQFAFLQA